MDRVAKKWEDSATELIDVITLPESVNFLKADFKCRLQRRKKRSRVLISIVINCNMIYRKNIQLD